MQWERVPDDTPTTTAEPRPGGPSPDVPAATTSPEPDDEPDTRQLGGDGVVVVEA